ncbi:17829_t:CDS:2 [Dentiscutata erythropus]|uniref:17829_t:CDS:1 n=1 Tax=Dentiscutata erythropus TaxID=1348616 RepID=A0A9N9I5Y6_9GLOM|nr:17829_t:CDS:2 [Dentiscutata erythropus]
MESKDEAKRRNRERMAFHQQQANSLGIPLRFMEMNEEFEKINQQYNT